MNETPMHTYQVLTKRADVLLKYDNLITWTPNIWMGVSVENSKVVERIDLLRKTHAQTKFLSIEPLIGALPSLDLTNIDWVIVGGESGHNARPIKHEWVVDIKKQCKRSKTSFFFKQWGKAEFNVDQDDPTIRANHPNHAKGGCLIDGKIYRAMPKKLAPLV
jgi:protein gp37